MDFEFPFSKMKGIFFGERNAFLGITPGHPLGNIKTEAQDTRGVGIVIPDSLHRMCVEPLAIAVKLPVLAIGVNVTGVGKYEALETVVDQEAMR